MNFCIQEERRTFFQSKDQNIMLNICNILQLGKTFTLRMATQILVKLIYADVFEKLSIYYNLTHRSWKNLSNQKQGYCFFRCALRSHLESWQQTHILVYVTETQPTSVITSNSRIDRIIGQSWWLIAWNWMQ